MIKNGYQKGGTATRQMQSFLVENKTSAFKYNAEFYLLKFERPIRCDISS